jgi:predicted alpha/beta hydrolase family esterase
MARVLILHGWTNRRQEGNWHRRLASALRQQGHQVIYPQFPNTDNPTLEHWQELLLAEIELLQESGEGETIAVSHSLGCVNFIHAAVEGKIAQSFDRLLMVAPADPALLAEIKGLNVDLAKTQTAQALKKAAHSITLVGSDEDPWLPNGIEKTYAKPLDLPLVLMDGAGHFNLASGFSQWQGVIDWINDPAADITVR